MPWLRQYVRYRAYSLMPDHLSVPTFGDANPQEHELIADSLTRVADHWKDGLAAWLAAVDRRDTGRRYRSFDFVWTTRVVPKGPDELPPSAVFTDLGVAILRTGWGADAAVVAMKCGPPGGLHAVRAAAKLEGMVADFGHDHPDAASFVYWNQRRWQIALPGGETRDKRSHSENGWLISGKGQRGEAPMFDASSYVGATAHARLLRVGSSAQADFAICEAAPAFEKEAGARVMRRTVVLVHGSSPVLIVYDRLSAGAPQVWSLLLHSPGGFATREKEHGFHLADPGGIDGLLFSPESMRLDTRPLEVIDTRMNDVARGFELEARTQKAVPSTWWVTALGANPSGVRVEVGPPLAVAIGSAHVSIDEAGNPSLDGGALEATLQK